LLVVFLNLLRVSKSTPPTIFKILRPHHFLFYLKVKNYADL
jgi:hypothetical protein